MCVRFRFATRFTVACSGCRRLQQWSVYTRYSQQHRQKLAGKSQNHYNCIKHRQWMRPKAGGPDSAQLRTHLRKPPRPPPYADDSVHISHTCLRPAPAGTHTQGPLPPSPPHTALTLPASAPSVLARRMGPTVSAANPSLPPQGASGLALLAPPQAVRARGHAPCHRSPPLSWRRSPTTILNDGRRLRSPRIQALPLSELPQTHFRPCTSQPRAEHIRELRCQTRAASAG